jgi:hypothetical protein
MARNQAAAPAERRLTWDAIRATYPDRWVALADVEWVDEDGFEFSQAEVVATFPDRKAASPTMKELVATGREVACLWTGERLLPKGGSAPPWRLRP